MGTVEDRREMFEGSVQTSSTPFSTTNEIGNPVTYKLVRVAGDGRLVAATDEEILEVNETDMHIASDACQTVGDLLVEGLPSQLESSQAISSGLLQSYNLEPSTEQYNEEVLQNVEQEEELGITHECQIPSVPPDANTQCSNENNLLNEDQVYQGTLLQELIPFSSNDQNGCDTNQPSNVEQCLNAAASPNETAAQKPDFSLVRGEIFLDNLPIKALQQTFRATFGRDTTVKDKTWLKRRITMGLVNSCDVPTTNLRIKDNKLVESNDATSVDMGGHVRATNSKDAPSSNGHGRSLGGDHYYATEDFSREKSGGKRLRKPTRRYIEELETDEKQQSEKSMIPSKDQRFSGNSEVRSISSFSGKRVALTRTLSLAGSEFEVPYVSNGRRSRPRENIMALMQLHPSWSEAKASAAESNLDLSPFQLSSEVLNRGSVEQKEFGTSQYDNEEPILPDADEDMEPEYIDSSGNSSDENINIGAPTPTMQGIVLRRKHHRAWTLSEVTTLVEGVSKYGAGKWSEIKKFLFSSHSYRTSVDLKDKWRNLLKVSFAPSNNTGSLKKHGSMHIPTEILLRVRELAEKQSLVSPISNRTEEETRTNLLS